MFEQYGYWVLLAGLVIAIASLIWLVARALRVSLGWGLACLVFPPAVLLFAARNFSRAKWPLAAMVLGLGLAVGTIAINRLVVNRLSLGPREKVVDGELHITLTGWDQSDYSPLEQRKETVVLQMANPDVADETLDYLAGMTRLRELDLNDSRITDEGLQKIALLPSLRVLRVRGTKVTAEGFVRHILPGETLREIDARETTISSKSLREWKAADKDGRKFLK